MPPFADWEMNPESAEKYTDVFQVIGDSRKSPGTPLKLSIESDTHKKDPNECKVGRLPWVSHVVATCIKNCLLLKHFTTVIFLLFQLTANIIVI